MVYVGILIVITVVVYLYKKSTAKESREDDMQGRRLTKTEKLTSI